MKEKKLRLLRIDWLDAFSQNDVWRPIDRMPGKDDRIEVSSVGWLLHTTKEYYVLVPTLTSHGAGCSAVAIPKKCVLNLAELRAVRKTVKRRR